MYKMGDKVMFMWQVCSYVGEHIKNRHLIDWVKGWHDWKIITSKRRAEKNWYEFIWSDYSFAFKGQLSPVPTVPTKKVTDLWKNEVIHCKTEEEAIRICRIMYEAGLRWNTRADYIRDSKWSPDNVEKWICYRPKEGCRSSLKYYKKEWNYTIYPSTDFHTEEVNTLGTVSLSPEPKMEMKVGDTIKIRERDDMVKEFWLKTDMLIRTRILYSKAMKEMCGKTYTIGSIIKRNWNIAIGLKIGDDIVYQLSEDSYTLIPTPEPQTSLYNVWDIVKIDWSQEIDNDGPENPKCNGEVDWVNVDGENWINVIWENGCAKAYRKEELILVEPAKPNTHEDKQDMYTQAQVEGKYQMVRDLSSNLSPYKKLMELAEQKNTAVSPKQKDTPDESLFEVRKLIIKDI